MTQRRETNEERYLHAMYDALKWIDLDLERNLAQGKGSVARVILAGVLSDAEYEPFLRHLDNHARKEQG